MYPQTQNKRRTIVITLFVLFIILAAIVTVIGIRLTQQAPDLSVADVCQGVPDTSFTCRCYAPRGLTGDADNDGTPDAYQADPDNYQTYDEKRYSNISYNADNPSGPKLTQPNACECPIAYPHVVCSSNTDTSGGQCGVNDQPRGATLTTPGTNSYDAPEIIETENTTEDVTLKWVSPTNWDDSCCRTANNAVMSEAQRIARRKFQLWYKLGANCLDKTKSWTIAEGDSNFLQRILQDVPLNTTVCWTVRTLACSSQTTGGTAANNGVKYFRLETADNPQCSDGIDNDSDGHIDCQTGNEDPGCFPNGNGGGGACNPDDDSEIDTPAGAVCGNGTIETGEQCDDGNTTAGDGCSATCQTTTQCSDGVDNDTDGHIDCQAGNEDPGCFPNGNGGGGACNPADNSEPDAAAAPVCGNGTIETGEQCDDDNTTNGDGCSSQCQTTTQCSDGVDNDSDGHIDCQSGNTDPGCFPDGNGGGGSCNPADNNETDLALDPVQINKTYSVISQSGSQTVIRYTLTASNPNSVAINNLIITDDLPSFVEEADVDYVSPTTNVDFDAGLITWYDLSVAADGTVQVRFDLTIASADYGSISNTGATYIDEDNDNVGDSSELEDSMQLTIAVSATEVLPATGLFDEDPGRALILLTGIGLLVGGVVVNRYGSVLNLIGYGRGAPTADATTKLVERWGLDVDMTASLAPGEEGYQARVLRGSRKKGKR